MTWQRGVKVAKQLTLRWGDHAGGTGGRGVRRERLGAAKLLSGMEGGATDQGARAASCLGKARGQISPGASRKSQPCPPLDFNPVRLVLDFWPPELLFETTKFVAVCYSSHRTLIHLPTFALFAPKGNATGKACFVSNSGLY